MRHSKYHIFPKAFSGIIICFGMLVSAEGQMPFIKASDLFPESGSMENSGRLTISHRSEIDTLISRYIYSNKLAGNGMAGFRIQIFRSLGRNARDESNKVRAKFMIDFPDIPSYAEYERPGYFLVRAGDFRNRMEGTKTLHAIRTKFPNAYMVPSFINFPDLNKY